MPSYRDISNVSGINSSAISSTTLADVIADASVASTEQLLLKSMVISNEHASQSAVVVVQDHTAGVVVGRFVIGARQTLMFEFGAHKIPLTQGDGLQAKCSASEGSCYVAAHCEKATVVSN